MIFARAVSTPEESLRVVTLAEATPEMADMRTVVLIGSSATRIIARDGAPFVYTPQIGAGMSDPVEHGFLHVVQLGPMRGAGRSIITTGRPSARAAAILA